MGRGKTSFFFKYGLSTPPVLDASDMVEADSRDFAFYAGHGGPGQISMNIRSDPPNPGCDVRMQENIRLGRYCGGNVKAVAYSASCVLGINEQICPLPPTPDDTTEPFSSPWPDLCWQPLRCTSARSLANHTFGFVDSPWVSDQAQLGWFGAMGSGRNATRAWISEQGVDEPTSHANQPAVLLRDDTSLSDRFFNGNLALGTGLNANTLGIDEHLIGFAYVDTIGNSGILDENGEPIMFGSQAPEEGYCTFGHAQACDEGLELDDPKTCN